MNSRCRLLCWSLLLIIVLGGCRTPEPTVSIIPTPSIPVTNEPQIVTPTSAPQILTHDNHLVICMEREPTTLFWYGRESVIEEAVLYGIYEPDLTQLSFEYQAVGLERIPSFANGDAAIRVVPVDEGDRVVDINGNVIEVEIGSQVINADGEISTYDGSTILVNQLVVDFKMKQRTWSDGQPVTAADSVYSFHLAARPEILGDKFLANRTAAYQATGNLQVRWTGIPGFIDDNFQTNFHHPLPRHTWLNLALVDLTSADVSSRFPVGDGPFQIVEWEQGDHIRLIPNPHYYRGSTHYPRVDGVTFRFIPDPNQRISQLLAGNCHVVTHEGLDAELIPFFQEAEAEQLIDALIVPDRFGWELVFGINSWGDSGDGIGRPDWFEDLRVRQAIAMCLDKQQIVDTLYFSQAQISDSYVPLLHPLSARDLSRWPYDVITANSLLDEVGYVDSNADGIREDPNSGLDFRISLLSGSSRREHQLAQMLQGFLQDCGIEVFVERADDQNGTSDSEINGVLGRRFDLALSMSEATHIPGCDRFTSREISGAPDEVNQQTGTTFIGWNGLNSSGWSNRTFDVICEAALASPAGSQEQVANHQQAQRIVAEELPIVPLVWEPKITLVDPNVLHISSDPSQDSELWNLYAVEFVP